MSLVGAELIHADSRLEVKANRRYNNNNNNNNNNMLHYVLPVFNISYKVLYVKITMTI